MLSLSLPEYTEPTNTCVPQTGPSQKRAKTRGKIPEHIVCVLFPETSLAIGHVLHGSRLKIIQIYVMRFCFPPAVQNHELKTMCSADRPRKKNYDSTGTWMPSLPPVKTLHQSPHVFRKSLGAKRQILTEHAFPRPPSCRKT